MIQVDKLSGGYGRKPVVKDISFKVKTGELFGILGPNGSGKTTLFKCLSGIIPFSEGRVSIKGRDLKSYSAKELAQVVAVLPQMTSQQFSYTVRETVALGRYAHQTGFFRAWSERDEAAVQQAMEQTGVANFAETSLQTLSGGERQRVFLAQALAQEPEILLLDEPTNHLDLSFQKDLMDLLKKMTKDTGITVVSIFHDLNLASLYCDRLLLVEKGRMHGLGLPSKILKEEHINTVYETDVHQRPHPEVAKPQMSVLPEKLEEDHVMVMINDKLIRMSDDILCLEAPIPLKTLSAGVVGAGWGWHRSFVNRHVSHDYHHEDHKGEMKEFIEKHGFDPNETVGMMTAVFLETAAFRYVEQEGAGVFAVVTAGVGNAVDASRGKEHKYSFLPGTINIWVFANGKLTEEAFVQAVMTATEAKVKALMDNKVKDTVTNTFATGTSTDSILIAATQRGRVEEFAGTISPLGKAIGQAVYEATSQALKNSEDRKKQL